MSNLSPSNAARRIVCPGSHVLEQNYKNNIKSPAAIEGENAHKLAAAYIKHLNDHKNAYFPDFSDESGEMKEGARLFVETVANIVDVNTVELYIEEPLDISIIHPNCKGTPDVWAFDAAKGMIYIFDYKYGHRYVEVYENWQLIEYAAGILNRLNIDGLIDQHIRINFYIVQPRCYHHAGTVRNWLIHVSDLRPLFNRLEQAEHAAMLPGAPCHPSPECTFCLARHACLALQNAALTAVDESYNALNYELSPEELGAELRLLKHHAELLNARINGLEAQAVELIKSGKAVTHYTLQATTGREKWIKSVDEIISMGALLGFNLKKPDDIITPAQAIKLGMPPEVVASLSERQAGALKLTEIDTNKTKKLLTQGK